VGTVQDDLLRAMLWGSLWDLVREAKLSPASFATAALQALPQERDEQIAGVLTGRLLTATSRYGDRSLRDAMQDTITRVLLAGAVDTMRTYGQRKSQLDALIGSASRSARTDGQLLAQLDAWLDADTAAGLPLRAPTRWAIVTKLIGERHPTGMARLQAEALRDSSSEGRRQAFVAAAAAPDSITKATYFARWFGDSTLNEEWVTSSLRAFHDGDQEALTQRYLVPSLDTLPWIQKNRRIFFLGAWLNAAIGGQNSATSLQRIDDWLAAHPTLGADLRRKVLQSRDELERTVRIRRAFPGGGTTVQVGHD
ncbi:MAG TPA: ERAP1-like C-terminal domain-containing protein, partial [Gemmatimonadaceae bacterium]|nr:ERAP1-like C-terminal domain-containing protein [Gemmatimonadaceae bacterium]